MNSGLADAAPYRIRVRGEVAETFIQLGWIDQLSIEFEPNARGFGVTTLEGDFDQAALRGLLSYLWDMNLTVLSVETPGRPRDMADDAQLSGHNPSNPSSA
jgi:hypothetical protein